VIEEEESSEEPSEDATPDLRGTEPYPNYYIDEDPKLAPFNFN